MVRVMTLTSVLSKILLVMMVANIILLIADLVPFIISILIMIICTIFRIGLSKLSWFLYFRSLNRCDTDYQGFLKEQNIYCKNSKLNALSVNNLVEQNKIAGMIYQEDFDAARQELIALGQTLRNADPLAKFQYLSFLLAIDIRQRKFAGAAHFIGEMRQLLSQTTFSGIEYNDNASAKFESILDGYRTSSEFYQINPDHLSSYDRTTAEKMIEKADTMLGFLPETRAFPHYFKLINYHDKALAYVLLDEKEKADPLFEEIAASGFTYPFVSRVKEYQKNGDIHLFF